jgi:hypothetical protein
MPAKFKDALRKLDSVDKHIQNVQSGRSGTTGEESMISKLSIVLEAFNKCAKQTNLKINKITVSNKNIRIEGDTSSKPNTLKFFESVKEKLEIVQFNNETKSHRDVFSLTAATKK